MGLQGKALLSYCSMLSYRRTAPDQTYAREPVAHPCKATASETIFVMGRAMQPRVECLAQERSR